MNQLFLFIFIATVFKTESKIEANSGKSYNEQKEHEVLIGRNFYIPCNFSTLSLEYPVLILLYKDVTKHAIYSLDSRTARTLFLGKRWTAPPYIGRLKLELGHLRQGFLLEDLRGEDEGLFICRVDYKSSPTRLTEHRVSVLKPANKLVLYLEGKSQRILHSGVIGPFDLGTELHLTCKAIGGKPNSEVSWWQGDTLLDSVSEIAVSEMTLNRINLPPLTSHDHNKELSCKANNSDVFPIISSTVTIKVKGSRKFVRIVTSGPFTEPSRGPKIVTMGETERRRFQCELLEEHPGSTLVWTKISRNGSNSSRNLFVAPFDKLNRTQNMTVISHYTDNEAVISCQAINLGYIPDEMDHYEDSIKLNILYKPRVLLSFTNIHNDSIEEGKDVYMRCDSDSNPPPFQIQWMHNGEKMQFPSTKAILDSSNTSLVLLSVKSTSSGKYSCAVRNSEGISVSNGLKLLIMGIPRCANNKRLLAANLHHTRNIRCEIESHPTATSFRWAFKSTNTSSESSNYNVLPHRISFGSIRYSLVSPSDFSTLLCWASNTLGEMPVPCSISIVPTGKPEPVSYCEIIHLKQDSKTIMKCLEGFNGGFPQSFTLTIWKTVNNVKHQFVSSHNSESATFNITDLDPGEQYLFNITAWNREGESNPVLLTYRNPRTLDTYPNVRPSEKIIPMASVIAGIVLTLIASLVFLLCCVKMRRCSKKKTDNTEGFVEDFYHERVITPLVNGKNGLHLKFSSLVHLLPSCRQHGHEDQNESLRALVNTAYKRENDACDFNFGRQITEPIPTT